MRWISLLKPAATLSMLFVFPMSALADNAVADKECLDAQGTENLSCW